MRKVADIYKPLEKCRADPTFPTHSSPDPREEAAENATVSFSGLSDAASDGCGIRRMPSRAASYRDVECRAVPLRGHDIIVSMWNAALCHFEDTISSYHIVLISYQGRGIDGKPIGW